MSELADSDVAFLLNLAGQLERARLCDDAAALRAQKPSEPIGRLIFEAAATGGSGHSRYPRYAHGMESVIPSCHKVVNVYLAPPTKEDDE